MIIETHNVDQSETFIRLYNEGKSRKEILDTLQIGKGAYYTYLRNNRHKIKTLTTTCPICGKTFHKKNRSHTYCSTRCKATDKKERERKNRQRNQTKKEKGIYKTCPICGKQFNPNSSSHKYCTPECAQEVKRRYGRKYYQGER